MNRPHNLRFQVDSRLATLLSQEYASSERALKELVDNAWDADAEQVVIQLPKPLSSEPIVIKDDGTGMTEEELRRHYLSIASDRRTQRGDRTVAKNRQVKGRKGIGKFAGLSAAATMSVETCARGKLCRIILRLDDLSKVEDIEHLNIGLHSESCRPDRRGTTIKLSDLHQGLTYPDANRLRQILLQDYGRQDGFSISVGTPGAPSIDRQAVGGVDRQGASFWRRMKMVKKYHSDALAAIHETMKALHKIGAVDKQTMREFDESCLVSVQMMSTDEIRAARA